MNRTSLLLGIACFFAAAVLAVITATFLAIGTERRSIDAVATSMEQAGLDWVEVSANGLVVYLDGTAPSEAASFRASSRAGSVISSDRVVNRVEVVQASGIAAPRFSVDMLRNGDGIQLIGLVPAATGSASVTEAISGIAEGVEVVDLIETADFPVPATWEDALEYGLRALVELPRSKVTVYSDEVEVQAVSESVEERAEFLAVLQQGQPRNVRVSLDISAPRPVITPFTLRFVIGEDGAQFETCAADTIAARQQILSAAESAGAPRPMACEIGLGVPSPQWGDAVETAIGALADLGAGTVAFSDADVTLIAVQGTEQDEFDRVIGELDTALPDVFSLSGVLPEPATAQTGGPARFLATLSEDGTIRLRGRLPEGPTGDSVAAYARALFGRDNTDVATRAVPDLSESWATRVMAGLEGLATLNDGRLIVEPDQLILRGRTGNSEAVSDLTRLFSEALGQAASYQLDVNYDVSLDPIASRPTGEECVARIQDVQQDSKITFEPGSVNITDEAGLILDRIASILPDCRHVRMEIAGHTDSQGGEDLNLNLSQARAEAVLNGLSARDVLVSNLTAQGYGETQPIESNDTDAGRERNRRIEFRLIASAEPEPDQTDTADTGAQAPGDDDVRPTQRPDNLTEAAQDEE